jgi:hypothetical protein
MPRSFLVTWLLGAIALHGCQVSTNERVLMWQEPAGPSVVREAPYAGWYRVYAAAGWRENARHAPAIVERLLCKGDAVGFSRDELGRIVAIMQRDRQLLEQSPSQTGYVWTMQPSAGQIDAESTAIFVAATIAIAVLIGVAIAVGSQPTLSSFNFGYPY